jgi:PDZ domain-containing protein
MNSKTPRSLKIFLTTLIAISLLAPMNFVLITPGEPIDLFPKTLRINSPISDNGLKSYSADGQLLLLTVYVTNPETKVLGAEVLGCWIWGSCVVMPRSVMYKKESNNKSEQSAGTAQMKESQDAAIVATKKILKKYFPNISTKKLSNDSLNVKLSKVGGPSGGLVFTLGLIELLTPENILRGRNIAATGTVDKDGTVGAIGGVDEKIQASVKAKATTLFISRQNCGDVSPQVANKDSKISIIAVDTVAEALAILRATKSSDPERAKIFNSAGLHGCANLGA